LEYRRDHEWTALVKKRFLTLINERDSCPAEFAAGQALTFLSADFP
jgi:hypothetical protein